MHKLVFILSLLLSFQPAFGASFDCGKAHSRMEKLICSDDGLSKADETLNVAYRQAAKVSNARPVIAEWQRQWLRSYEVAGCEDVRCLTAAFTTRIQVLESVAPADNGSSKWTGEFIRFRNGKEDPNSTSLLLVGLRDDRVYVTGESIWIGPNAASGQVNTGEIDAIGEVASGKLVFDSDGCTGEVLLSREGIAVLNESGCGGLNVTFDGDYRKK